MRHFDAEQIASLDTLAEILMRQEVPLPSLVERVALTLKDCAAEIRSLNVELEVVRMARGSHE